MTIQKTGDKKTTELVQLLNGDSSVVNVIQGHPTEPLMAVSGIDNTVKIFSPDQQLQQQAREGVGINNGRKLQSRQKMNEKDDIIGENEVGRQSGLRDAGTLSTINSPSSCSTLLNFRSNISDIVITVSLRHRVRERVPVTFAEWILMLSEPS